MPLSISKIKTRIRRDIRIIDSPEDVAKLLDISSGTLRNRFRQEEQGCLWMFILKEKSAHCIENLPPYPAEANEQLPNARKAIHSYCSALPSPDRTWHRDVREMVTLINNNPFDFHLNVNWIRNKLNILPQMYAQRFYYSARMQVTKYIRWRRIEMAKYLLYHSSLKIGDIALLVGYNSPSAFSNAFIQDVGDSPRIYRKKGLKPKRP